MARKNKQTHVSIVTESPVIPLDVVQSGVTETCTEETSLHISETESDTGQLPCVHVDDDGISVDIEVEREEVEEGVRLNPYSGFMTTEVMVDYLPLIAEFKKQHDTTPTPLALNTIEVPKWQQYEMRTEIPADSIWLTKAGELEVAVSPVIDVRVAKGERPKGRLRPNSLIHQGREIAADDLVPMSGIAYDPEGASQTVKVLDGTWIADDTYLLVNYAFFPTHFELQLEKL